MSLGAIIKRHKRTLINFQQSFLLPFVKKAAYRYMQFDPENYPVKDYKFNAASTLGIIAREYEVTQLTQLLQTMPPDSPLYPTLVQSIVDNMNLSNREELLATLEQASQPNPEAQRAQQEQQQAALEFQKSQTQAINAEAAYSEARARKIAEETRLLPLETQAKLINSATSDLQDDGEAKDFERRMNFLDRQLEATKLEQQGQKHNDEMKLKVIQTMKQQGGGNANSN